MKRWIGVILIVTACSGADDPSSDTTVVAAGAPTEAAATTDLAMTTTTSAATTTSTTTTSTTAATSPTSTAPTTTTPTTSTSTSTTSTVGATTAPSTTPPPPPQPPRQDVTLPPIDSIDAFALPTDVEVEIGRSVEDRPITVIRRGAPGGTRVLAVGVIHGNEAAGTAIIDRLAVEPVPDGVELWLVRSMNPDGQARRDRQNANAVDLNRNFPENWDVLGEPGFWQYAGSAPSSEPETQAMIALGDALRPEVLLWYHQDLFRIAPGSGRSGDIRTRYAQVAGLPVVDITGGTYTGTASQWSRTVIPEVGVGITVELGPTLSEPEIAAHVAAVHAVATEFF